MDNGILASIQIMFIGMGIEVCRGSDRGLSKPRI